jgi:hypothetical protein
MPLFIGEHCRRDVSAYGAAFIERVDGEGKATPGLS